jgi:hypothetical protein
MCALAGKMSNEISEMINIQQNNNLKYFIKNLTLNK